MPREPARDELVGHVSNALAGYWVGGEDAVAALPINVRAVPVIDGPLQLESVRVPEWAAHCAVDGSLLVPREACGADRRWAGVDWWLAAFLLLEAWHERVHEERHGPVHSWSRRLRGWDSRVWEHAWVNRIGLFIRAWAAEAAQADFGPPPAARILLTHDVDAVAKTWAIRCKQGAFHLFNAGRLALAGRLRDAGARVAATLRLLVGDDDWMQFDALLARERAVGLRARFHFHADPRVRTPVRRLFDPGYDIGAPQLVRLLKAIRIQGGEIGLHPGYDSWRSTETIAVQRDWLEHVSGGTVSVCRQHWLRFGWAETWVAQSSAGLQEDTTLMFNDRPGFRNAAALQYRPWDIEGLVAMPTVFMDSHFYDYYSMAAEARTRAIRRWLGEVRAVGGTAAVLWHPHTLSADYGWREGFEILVTELERVSG